MLQTVGNTVMGSIKGFTQAGSVLLGIMIWFDGYLWDKAIHYCQHCLF